MRATATPTRAIVALSCAACASAASLRVCDPLLPRLSAEYGIGLGIASQTVTAFAIAYGVLQLAYGPIGDRFGNSAARLLLREAMQGPQPQHEVDGMDADDVAIGEEVGERVEGFAVGGVVEGRDEDGPIGDVEIRVAGRQPQPLEDDWPRHRQLDHVQRLTVLVVGGP